MTFRASYQPATIGNHLEAEDDQGNRLEIFRASNDEGEHINIKLYAAGGGYVNTMRLKPEQWAQVRKLISINNFDWEGTARR